jgi:hypothetical protein
VERRIRLEDVFRGLTVGAAVLLTLVLAALLPQPGYSTTRLAYVLLVVAVAWVGSVGALRCRPPWLAGSGVGLFLLGFWQFTIGLVMLPTAALYLVTAVVLYDQAGDRAATTAPSR